MEASPLVSQSLTGLDSLEPCKFNSQSVRYLKGQEHGLPWLKQQQRTLDPVTSV